MKDRFVLVTGASRGLGRSIARDLAGRGFSVFAGVRQPEDGEDLAQMAPTPGTLHPLVLDVASHDSLEAAAEEIEGVTSGRGLAGLVNNAALFLLGPFEQTPFGMVESLFRANVLGVIATTQRLLPLLRQARGRIVNISSVNGRLSPPFASFYGASKFAIEALSDSLRVELQPWGIGVSVVEPGATRTDIRARGVLQWSKWRAALTPEESALYEASFVKLREMIAKTDLGAAGHDEVLRAVHDALTAETPQTRYLAGPDAEEIVKMAALSDQDRDAALAKLVT